MLNGTDTFSSQRNQTRPLQNQIYLAELAPLPEAELPEQPGRDPRIAAGRVDALRAAVAEQGTAGEGEDAEAAEEKAPEEG